MKTEILSSQHPTAIAHAIDILSNGGLVAFPTDTVYGLAAPAFHEAGIERLFIAKGRNHTKAIALLLGEVDQLDQVAVNISPAARQLAEHFWPGPLTLVLHRHPSVPAILSPEPTIGVRIPDHPDALALLRKAGPLAVTSANISGNPSTRSAQDVLAQLDGRVHLVLDGGSTPGGVPSTVVDCTTQKIQVLRPGPLSLEALLEVVK